MGSSPNSAQNSNKMMKFSTLYKTQPEVSSFRFQTPMDERHLFLIGMDEMHIKAQDRGVPLGHTELTE